LGGSEVIIRNTDQHADTKYAAVFEERLMTITMVPVIKPNKFYTHRMDIVKVVSTRWWVWDPLSFLAPKFTGLMYCPPCSGAT
jgi:hypothetical protein